MSNEITLPIGASAEPDTCGSCKFFDRTKDNVYYAMDGYCRIKMPPLKEQFAVVPYKPGDEETRAPNYLKDTSRCDLYRFSGKVYIVQRRIPPERIG